MIPGFSGHTMALLLILQGVLHNRQNFEQPLSISYPEFGLNVPRSRVISSNITAHFPARPASFELVFSKKPPTLPTILQRSLMPLIVVEMTGASVFMLTWALSTPAKGHEGGITAHPLFTTARFDQRHPLTATEATRLTSHRCGFHPVVCQGLSSIRRRWIIQVDIHTPASLY